MIPIRYDTFDTVHIPTVHIILVNSNSNKPTCLSIFIDNDGVLDGNISYRIPTLSPELNTAGFLGHL